MLGKIYTDKIKLLLSETEKKSKSENNISKTNLY